MHKKCVSAWKPEGGGTVQENGFNAVISDDFSKMFQNATKVLLRLSDNDGAWL